jgi:hypothetical protein
MSEDLEERDAVYDIMEDTISGYGLMQTALLIVAMAQRRPAQYENALEARLGRKESR